MAGQSLEVTGGEPIVLGRDPSESPLATLLTAMYGVSRRHATITLQGSEVMIQDLGSTNGTWLDGARLGPEPVVRPLPIVFRLGQTVSVEVRAPGAAGNGPGGSGAARR
ncbi:MAG: FHA domain-containing protein [Bifidobacteriaceae bacterium]|nr:FHA domain-containing protein [Bifidobacteriaceae bacterium]